MLFFQFYESKLFNGYKYCYLLRTKHIFRKKTNDIFLLFEKICEFRKVLYVPMKTVTFKRSTRTKPYNRNRKLFTSRIYVSSCESMLLNILTPKERSNNIV